MEETAYMKCSYCRNWAKVSYGLILGDIKLCQACTWEQSMEWTEKESKVPFEDYVTAKIVAKRLAD